MSDPEKRRQYDQFGHAALTEVREAADMADSTLTVLILATFSEILIWGVEGDERYEYP